VVDVYFVGGFAAMGWIDGQEYAGAEPDPLGEVAPSILEHMNRDHRDALVKYARGLAHVTADEATMIAVDRLGFRLRVRSGDRLHAVRIAFPREVRTMTDARTVLIEMLRTLPEGTT
jgi:putative heme iron utilization protein